MWGPRRTMNHLDQPQAADPRRQLIPSVGNPAFNYGSRSLSALVPAHSLFVIVPPAATPTIPPELNGAKLQINALPWVFFNAETSLWGEWDQRERERERERERNRVLFSRWTLAALLRMIRCGWSIEKLDREDSLAAGRECSTSSLFTIIV